jgi:hypothetical protein
MKQPQPTESASIIHPGGFQPLEFAWAANSWCLRQHTMAERIEMQEEAEFEDWELEGIRSC